MSQGADKGFIGFVLGANSFSGVDTGVFVDIVDYGGILVFVLFQFNSTVNMGFGFRVSLAGWLWGQICEGES